VRYGDTKEEHDRIDAVAQKLNTHVPGYITRDFWSLPILEKLVERIEALEKDKQQDKR
jgi:hypothetical protein